MLVGEKLNTVMDRRKVQAVVQALDYDFTAFTIESFVQYVERLRQRPIILQAYAFSRELSGMVFSYNGVDFIIYLESAHPILQTHIILHEIAHMLLKHPGKPIREMVSPEIRKEFQSDLWGLTRSVAVNRHRDDYEYEAEYFVKLIQRKVMKQRRIDALTAPGTSIDELRPFIESIPFAPQKRKK